MTRTYLDNAATSWPKPESVYQAVDYYQRELGVAAGRGTYRRADEVLRTISRCRLAISKLLHAQSPREIIFTQNCTDSLNFALHGLLQRGDHVVTTAADHNSVLRPLHHLQRHGVQVTRVSLTSEGIVDMEAMVRAVAQQPVKLIAMNHVSNVTGTRQPVEEIGALAKQYGTLLLLDAAQSMGHEPVDVQAMGADLLAAPGHKGLMGPLGTGILYVREAIQEIVQAVRQGGTGTQSELAEQPSSGPEKYESGNLNVPGIVGLDAGVAYVRDQHVCESSHLFEFTEYAIEQLSDMPTVTLYSRPNRYGIVSFTVDGFEPTDLATMLDGIGQIEVRAGLHCAPAMHEALGTIHTGGTVRASFGHFSKQCDAQTLIDTLQTLAADPLK